MHDSIRNHNMDAKEKGEVVNKLAAGNPAAKDGFGTGYPSPPKGKYNTDDDHNPDVKTFPKDAVGAVPKDDVPSKLVRTYVPAKLAGDGDPMLWLLRFADNMDASKGRLTATQQDQGLEECWARLYGDETIRAIRADSTKNRDEQDELAKPHLEKLKKDYPQCKNSKFAANFVNIPQIDDQGFPHFFSNFAVEKTSLASTKDAETVTLTVKFLTGAGDILTAANFPEVALYQINRMAEALESLTWSDGSSVIEHVDVTLVGHPNAGTYKLAAFNAATAKKAGKCAAYNAFHVKDQACYATTEGTAAKAACRGFFNLFTTSC